MSTNIKVCVRVRPENVREREAGQKPVVAVLDESMLIFDPVYDASVTYFHGRVVKDPTSRKPREAKFAFDHVFGPSSTNIEVYEQTTKSVLRALVEGYNCSVFAYGATGAGKTFSMLGSPQTPGVIFLSMMDLYNIKESEKDERKIDVSVSYLEVYNENIKDLLSPGSGNLPIRENGKQGIVVTGLTVREPNSAEELLQMLEKGNKSRTQHPTDANAESSRSHAIFQVFVRVQNATAGLKEDVRVSKLSLIDLAGSERATVTKNKGARLREGANINKSLLALGNCINALADTKRKGSKHVPYRNSKLTRILKDSLGDNCKTVMLAAVSPSRHTYEDTYNTLSYADRAKKIKAVLKKNVFSVASHMQNYGKVVDDLQSEVAKLKEKLRIQTEQLAERASLTHMTPLATATPAGPDQTLPVPVTAAVCEFNIDQLQNDISKTYGERRQIRDDLLHIELMQKQAEYTIIKKRRVLDRLDMMSSQGSVDSQAGNQTIGKVTRALGSALNKQKNLEKTKSYELSQLADNTATLKQLIEQGKDEDNDNARQILSLQMKCYNYEQESREYQKENQYLQKFIHIMREEQLSNNKMLSMFVEFLRTSEGLLAQYGLQSEELTGMYKNMKEAVVNERHVQFTTNEEEKSREDNFNSLLNLHVVSANENSLQLTGEPILTAEVPQQAANTTVTINRDALNGTFVLDQPASASDTEGYQQEDISPEGTPSKSNNQSSVSPNQTSQTSSTMDLTFDVLLTPTKTDDVTSQPAKANDITPSKINDASDNSLLKKENNSDKDIISNTPESGDDVTGSRSDYVFTKLRSSPRISASSRSIFKPVHEVLSLIRGTGCDEQVGEGGDDDITSECKPAKLRVIGRSPESELGTTTSQVSYGSNTLSAVRGSHNDSAAGEAQLTESPKKEQAGSDNKDLETTPNVSLPDQPRHRLSYTVAQHPDKPNNATDTPQTSGQSEAEPMDVSYTMNNSETLNNTVTVEHHSPQRLNDHSQAILSSIRTPTLTSGMTFADAVRSPVPTAQPLSQVNQTPPAQRGASLPGYLKMTKASSSKRSRTSNQSINQEN